MILRIFGQMEKTAGAARLLRLYWAMARAEQMGNKALVHSLADSFEREGFKWARRIARYGKLNPPSSLNKTTLKMIKPYLRRINSAAATLDRGAYLPPARAGAMERLDYGVNNPAMMVAERAITTGFGVPKPSNSMYARFKELGLL